MGASRKKGRMGGARPGAGRKPKPPAEKQSEKIQAAFTPAELRELREAAGGRPVGSYLRELVLRHLSRRRK